MFKLMGRGAACLVASFVSLAFGAQPWSVPFSENIEESMRAAKAVKHADQPEVIVLLNEQKFTLRVDGRIETTIRHVYRVDQQDAVENWSSVEQQYQSWYQDKPELRARVISPGGNVRWLDPKTIGDAPAHVFESNIFSDARILRAPLPAVAAGVIVEYEIKVRDRIPMLNAGTGHRITLDRTTPTERFHALIQAEPGVTLRTAAHSVPESAIQRETSKSGTRIDVEFGPSDPAKDFEGNLPFEDSGDMYLSFSNGISWQGVATAYADMVNAKIGGGGGLNVEAEDRHGSAKQIATKLTARLHKQIRYTGVEFGESAIVPVTPAETVTRGYGDCKDKATVLVAVLRAAGLKADVALLLSGVGPDVDVETPGLGQFDHAIVYVDTNPPLWIDATAAEVRVGMLPPADQGRLALIANAQTTTLVKTPESTVEDNWQRNTIEIKMSELGPSEIRAVMEGSGGWYEANARSNYGGDGKRAKQGLEALVKLAFVAKSLGAYKLMPNDDLSGPYRMEVTAHQASIASTGTDDASAALSPFVVFEFLPYGLMPILPQAAGERVKRRQHDFLFAFPFESEYHYRIIPPLGFKLSSKPVPVESKLGPATLSRKYKVNGDGTVEVDFHFDVAKRRWTPDEVETFRAAFKEHNNGQPEVLSFLPETSELVAAGQIGKAIAILRGHVEQDPNNAMARGRYARLLLVGGMGGLALAEAKEAVRLDPNAAPAWLTLGFVYQHDTFGRMMKGNWNYDEAERCLRKAVEIDSSDIAGKMNLAIFLEYNRLGWRYARDGHVKEAIALYRELAESPLTQTYPNLTFALLQTGQFEAAKVEAKKCPEQLQALVFPLIQALQDGAAPAMAKATTGMSEARQRAIALATISFSLSMMREYDLAKTFMSAAGRVGNLPELSTRAELLGSVKRWEDTVLREYDPAWPVQQLLLKAMHGASIPDTMRALLSERYTSNSWKSALTTISHAIAGIHKDLSGQGMDDEALLDYVASLTAVEMAGDEKHGYRIKSTMPGWGQLPAMYVVNERSQYRVVAVLPSDLDAVGDLVLALLDKKDLEGAQWWLDRVAADVEARSDGTGVHPGHGLWTGMSSVPRGPAAIRLAAASLISAGRLDEPSIQALREARRNAATQPERDKIHKALCEGLARAGEWNELMMEAKQLLASKLFSEEAFRYFLKGAAGAGNWKELEVEALKRATANPTNIFAVRMVVLAKARLGDEAGLDLWAKKMLASPLSGLDEQMLAAWLAVDSGKPIPGILEKLQNSPTADRASSYEVAALQAALHRPDEGMQSLLRGIDRQDYDHLGPKAWLAYSTICKEYGFPAEASSAQIHASEAIGDEEDGPGFALIRVRVLPVVGAH